MATTRKKKAVELSEEPTVVVGSHLTVTTYPDGRTELVWDDEALTRDVRDALQQVESAIPVESKPKRKSKKDAQ